MTINLQQSSEEIEHISFEKNVRFEGLESKSFSRSEEIESDYRNPNIKSYQREE